MKRAVLMTEEGELSAYIYAFLLTNTDLWDPYYRKAGRKESCYGESTMRKVASADCGVDSLTLFPANQIMSDPKSS